MENVIKLVCNSVIEDSITQIGKNWFYSSVSSLQLQNVVGVYNVLHALATI